MTDDIVERLDAIQTACGCVRPIGPDDPITSACERCEIEADLCAEIERLRAAGDRLADRLEFWIDDTCVDDLAAIAAWREVAR